MPPSDRRPGRDRLPLSSMTPETPPVLPPRRGRPRADQAGEVDQRILDAATTLMLVHGYAGTSVDQVASAAHTGKTTLYGRYPTKGDLFAAVVRRSSAGLSQFVVEHGDGTPGERLTRAGIALADLTLTTDSIALMKVTSAESETFPELAKEGFRIGFGECARSIAECLVEITTLDTVEDAQKMGERFVELALHPLYMHAFFGEDLPALRERARRDIPGIADFFLTAFVTPR
jgi:AcrR family transcriptional regulator